MRERRTILAHYICNAAQQAGDARIFSLACGFLREAGDAAVLKEKGIDELVAADQDERALSEVRRSCDGLPVTALRASVREVLTGKCDLGSFDLAYSAGLYDYLGRPVAARLTEVLFSMLRPGGRLLVANFLPDICDVGYMETYMDWRLIYRDEQAMQELAEGIDPAQIAQTRTFRESNDNIVFLELTRG